MNNQQFRNLLLTNAQRKDGSSPNNSTSPTTSTTSRPSATPALGSRKTSSIPMTPRQLGGRPNIQSEFARQLAERNRKAGGPPPSKKFKSSAPKGVKLAAGYTDRAALLREKEREKDGEKGEEGEEEDETAQRIKKLEEAMKLGQIERAQFEALVLEITGGDISNTHLVKGLDRKLLERVRQGEVSLAELDAAKAKATRDNESGSPEAEEEGNSDDEFAELEEREIAPVVKAKADKKGEKAPPSAPAPVAGVKRSRNDILAELKAQRAAAAAAAAAEHEKKYPTLGSGFRKVGPGGETTRIEIDDRGREVLIITSADGKEKRKVRKQKAEEPKLEVRFDIENPEKPVHIPDVTQAKPQEDEEEDDDIFEGVGADYNPLANLGDEDDEEDEEESSDEGQDKEEGEVALGKPARPISDEDADADKPLEEPAPQPPTTTTTNPPSQKRNYFATTSTTTPAPPTDAADATVRAALAKVRTLDPTSSTLLADTEEARLAKRAAELAARDRDMEDLDLGFGESRFDDAEDMEMEGQKVKLSEWKGLGAAEEDEEGGKGKGGVGGGKRKRGPKKKRGDKNSVADVLKVMERQKGGKTLG